MSDVILNLRSRMITNRSIEETNDVARKLALTGVGQIRSNMRNITSLTGAGCSARAGEAGLLVIE